MDALANVIRSSHQPLPDGDFSLDLIGLYWTAAISQQARQFKSLVCGGDKEWARSIKMRCAKKSLFSPPMGLRFLMVGDARTASSFLWFAAIQGVECKERLVHLAPQVCFISG
jgi:hypothetical protein